MWTRIFCLSDWFTLFVAATDVHEQLPHQFPCHLVKGSSLRGDNSVLGSIVPPHLEANSILEKKDKSCGDLLYCRHQQANRSYTLWRAQCWKCFCTSAHTGAHKNSRFLPGDKRRREVKLRYDSPLTHWCWQSAPQDESLELEGGFTLRGFSVCVCENNAGSQIIKKKMLMKRIYTDLI